jgi:hypothetical protein
MLKLVSPTLASPEDNPAIAAAAERLAEILVSHWEHQFQTRHKAGPATIQSPTSSSGAADHTNC